MWTLVIVMLDLYKAISVNGVCYLNNFKVTTHTYKNWTERSENMLENEHQSLNSETK